MSQEPICNSPCLQAPEAALGQGPPPAPAAAKAEAPRDVPIPVGIAPVAVRTPGVSTAPSSGPLPSSAAAPVNRERSSANSTPQSRGRAGEAAPFSRPGPIPPSPSSSAGGSSANVAMHGPNRTPPYHTGQMQAQHRAFVPGSGHRGPSPTAPRGPHQGGSPNLGMNMHYPGAMQGYGAYAYAPGPGYAQHGWQANLQQYAYYPNYGGVPPQYPNYLDQQAGPGQQGGGQQGSLPHVQHGVSTGRGGPPPQGHYAPPTGAPHAQGGSSGPAPPPPQQQQGQGQPAKHVPIKRERRVSLHIDEAGGEGGKGGARVTRTCVCAPLMGLRFWEPQCARQMPLCPFTPASSVRCTLTLLPMLTPLTVGAGHQRPVDKRGR